MDTSIDPAAAADTASDNVELPASVDSLMVDGVRPQVGDQVELRVGGDITRVVNDMAYVKPMTINDQPMEVSPLSPSPAVDEGSRLRDLSMQSGDAASGNAY